MNSMQEAQTIDLDLVDQVIEHIPSWTWEDVKQAIITNIVDCMPSDILEKLTGSYEDFDKAEEILRDYYKLPELKKDLIVDAFKLVGVENTVYLLDALQLDKRPNPAAHIDSTDNAPCSIDPQ